MKNDYVIRGDIVVVYLFYRGDKYECLIDKDSFDVVSSYDYTWYAIKSGNKLYAATTIRENGRRRTVKMHRVISKCPDNLVVDHINGNSLDNRKENLRLCDNKENVRNRLRANRDNNSTGILGVYKRADNGKYRAAIGFDNKIIWIGTYDTAEDAADARMKWEKALYRFSPYNRKKGACGL